MENQLYLIWSTEHDAWWKPNWKGYTKNRKEAGKYSFRQATRIVNEANINLKDIPNESMIMCTEKDLEN